VQPLILAGLLRRIRYFLSGHSLQQVNQSIKYSSNSLEKIKSSLNGVGKNLQFFTWVSFGEPLESAIIQKATRLGADLIVIGKRSHHTSMPFLNTVVPSRLAAASGIPVLLAKPGSLNRKIETVVIPVGTEFPTNKLEIMEALRKDEKQKIRLVVFWDDIRHAETAKQSLLQTFQVLKNRFCNPVSYEVLKGKNKAKALFTYCNQVGADLLIVHPDSETRIKNWTNSHISDLFPTNSKTQVMNVRPS
jgi:hypothetical protein